jgi:peptidoglycan-associated lipoprotein
MLMATLTAMAQNTAPARNLSVDVGIAWSPEYAKIVNQSCSCFWLQGVSADASVNFYRGLGLAVDLTEGMASNIQPGVNLSKFTFAAGPRYTWNLDEGTKDKPGKYPARVFAQTLFGEAHGYNSVFPATGGAVSSANSYSIQVGGGIDMSLAHNFGVRIAQLDWVRTALPNTVSNTQDDLRLGFGVSYHFKKK